MQKTCKENGAVFILDEMITGFRWHLGGAQKYYGITPDLSTFGKCIGNGFSLGALVGKREIMERGGIEHAHERVFLLSLTHGAESHCLAAAIETMRIYKREKVVEQLHKTGRAAAEWNQPGDPANCMWRAISRCWAKRRIWCMPRRDRGEESFAGLSRTVHAGNNPARVGGTVTGGQLFS